ncbi:alpha/beta hydrolase [Nocardia abscessus]|uniref:alpha/beta hydrolase n=1 Tax=Nocardia abscessus TaxID=120957 RepID=UPI002458902A|nr:alpha/beta hydrolase [Nocardia abscessus]
MSSLAPNAPITASKGLIMPSLQAKEVEQIIEDYKAGVIGKGQALTMDERRGVTDQIGKWATIRDDVELESVQLGGREASRYVPISIEPGMVMLYFHGGGYVMGSLNSHGRLMAHVAHHCSAPVYGLDFRRAPESPFPAALNDSRSAYKALLEMGWRPDQIVLAGDSAGGGLVLALMALAREAGEAAPAGGILLSPWLDLALTGDSMERLAAGDVWTTRPTLSTFAKLYAGDAALDDPKVSPLYMDFTGLPPLLIHVSGSEILLDDAVRARDSASASGVEVEFRSWAGVPHVFQLFTGNLPEAEESLKDIGAWLDKRRAAVRRG